MKFNDLVPELSVSDINKSKDFYINILGFNLEYERLKDKFAFLSYGGAQIMTDDVYEVVNKLKQNNISLFRDIMVNRYECDGQVFVEKEILLQDPDGYLLRFSQTESCL